jgi:predicted ester cyclase
MKKFMMLHFGFEKPTPAVISGGREISKDGTSDLPWGMESITGYNIIEAEDLDAEREATMMTPKASTTVALALLAISLATLASACTRAANGTRAQAEAELCAARLATFDTLDYDVFSNQQWDRLSESHASDIVVTWPDGRETSGIAQHIEDLKAMFVFAPNTSIKEHPFRVCSGDYTAVMGVMTGTFSQPMPTPGGRTIPPTGKSFRLSMATLAHWQGSTMIHEWLFWDNHEFMRQIGLVQ